MTLPRSNFGLAEAVDLALCHNPQVQMAWAATKLQAALLGESRAAWLPTANATISDLHNRTTYPTAPALDSSSSGRTAYAAVTWRIFDFGARAADQQSASRLLDAALANHDAALQKALSGVIQAYFDAVSTRAAMRSRNDATKYAQQTLEATDRREARGAAAAGDSLQARAALAKARLAGQRAIGDLLAPGEY
jgi:outer membrane protein